MIPTVFLDTRDFLDPQGFLNLLDFLDIWMAPWVNRRMSKELNEHGNKETGQSYKLLILRH